MPAVSANTYRVGLGKRFGEGYRANVARLAKRTKLWLARTAQSPPESNSQPDVPFKTRGVGNNSVIAPSHSALPIGASI